MCDTEESWIMAIVIIILLSIADLGIAMIMLMVAAIVGNKSDKPKTYEQAQADLFKAWGDSVINEYKSN